METKERLEAALSGRYRIVREIGRGGMAIVYLASDEKHGRSVAIKVLRPELSAAVGAERFLREIEIAAQLNHPNILALHDSGEAEGLLYFVMPYVEGESLRARMAREAPMDLDEAVRITEEIGRALAYAHDQGVVHRDVKPENVLFQAGHAVVCDFGVARATSEAQDRLTQTGLAIGTVDYMSPEQMSGDAEIDGRTDVYALGCILFEMLADGAPFDAPHAQAVLTRKMLGRMADLAATRPDVPPTVHDVVTRSLAPLPDERFETAEAFISDLAHATTEVAVARDARRRRTARRVRRAATVAAVAVTAATGWWITSRLAAPAIERVAVLPLANAAGDPDQEFFVQGVHEDLVLELARAGVRVINPASVRRYASTELPVRDIAAELGVDAVIQGSASLSPSAIDVDLSLVDGETDEVLWVESFTADRRSVVSLYNEVTLAVATRIEYELTPEAEARLASAEPVDPQIYEALLQARFNWQKLTEEGLATALDYYTLALERDSTSVEALAGVAQVWAVRAQQGLVSAEEALRESEEVLARARALEPETFLGDGNLALRQTWIEWNFDDALANFRRSLDSDPTDSVLRAYYSLLLLYLGRDEEGAEESERAAEMDPFNTLVQGLYAQGLNARGLYDEAETVLLRALERDRDAPIVLSTLRTTYHLMGRHEEAMQMWRSSYAASGDAEALAALERGYAEGGYESALRSVAELFVERSDTAHVTPWQIGTLYTRAGMRDEALDYLEAAYAARDPNSPYLSVDPIFDFLRDEPRFQALLEGIGLPR